MGDAVVDNFFDKVSVILLHFFREERLLLSDISVLLISYLCINLVYSKQEWYIEMLICFNRLVIIILFLGYSRIKSIKIECLIFLPHQNISCFFNLTFEANARFVQDIYIRYAR